MVIVIIWSSWLLWSFSVQSWLRFHVSDAEYFILTKNKIIVELWRKNCTSIVVILVILAIMVIVVFLLILVNVLIVVVMVSVLDLVVVVILVIIVILVNCHYARCGHF